MFKHKTSTALYAHWDAVRAGRLAPRRFEIEPSQIAAILPDTFVLEKADDGAYRYRLAGTRMCERFGREFRGTDFFTQWSRLDRANLERLFQLASHGAGARYTLLAEAGARRVVELEMLILPLVHTSNIIDRFVGCLTPLSEPEWLGYEPISTLRISDHEPVWPDGNDVVRTFLADRTSPESARAARLVKQDQRSFRVYDGGRN